jgi:hypothetical protein
VTGVAQFTRTGAHVRVVYQRYFAGDPHCLDAGAPATAARTRIVIEQPNLRSR